MSTTSYSPSSTASVPSARPTTSILSLARRVRHEQTVNDDDYMAILGFLQGDIDAVQRIARSLRPICTTAFLNSGHILIGKIRLVAEKDLAHTLATLPFRRKVEDMAVDVADRFVGVPESLVKVWHTCLSQHYDDEKENVPPANLQSHSKFSTDALSSIAPPFDDSPAHDNAPVLMVSESTPEYPNQPSTSSNLPSPLLSLASDTVTQFLCFLNNHELLIPEDDYETTVETLSRNIGLPVLPCFLRWKEPVCLHNGRLFVGKRVVVTKGQLPAILTSLPFTPSEDKMVTSAQRYCGIPETLVRTWHAQLTRVYGNFVQDDEKEKVLAPLNEEKHTLSAHDGATPDSPPDSVDSPSNSLPPQTRLHSLERGLEEQQAERMDQGMDQTALELLDNPTTHTIQSSSHMSSVANSQKLEEEREGLVIAAAHPPSSSSQERQGATSSVPVEGGGRKRTREEATEESEEEEAQDAPRRKRPRWSDITDMLLWMRDALHRIRHFRYRR
ncbi:hypothetical protein BDZ89DRAFT_1058077 [Hymenopellis radicata]|nr:hypothetical protein BDZ89DRAFT_1058077 [Hymenopellis radicata]